MLVDPLSVRTCVAISSDTELVSDTELLTFRSFSASNTNLSVNTCFSVETADVFCAHKTIDLIHKQRNSLLIYCYNFLYD